MAATQLVDVLMDIFFEVFVVVILMVSRFRSTLVKNRIKIDAFILRV